MHTNKPIRNWYLLFAHPFPFKLANRWINENFFALLYKHIHLFTRVLEDLEMTESVGGGMPNHLRIQWKLKVNHSKSGKKLLSVGYEKIDSYFKIFKSLQRFRQFKF